MTPEAPGTLAASIKIYYFRMLLFGEFLLQLNIFFAEVGSTNTTYLN